MIRLRLCGIDFAFSFWFFTVSAIFALLDSGALALYILLPVALHELGHLTVMTLCGIRVRGVCFTAFGVDIRREGGAATGYGREAAIALGGVAANLLLAAGVWLFFPFKTMRLLLLAASSLAIAVFSLAPIGDLDGGQLVKLIAARFLFPAAARTVSRVASFLTLGVLFGIAGFLFSVGMLNMSLLAACLWLAFNVITRE